MYFWYAVPLIVSISLVYAATRHEHLAGIGRDALWFGTMVTLILGGFILVLWPLCAWL